MECPYCGNVIEKGEFFCSGCGHLLPDNLEANLIHEPPKENFKRASDDVLYEKAQKLMMFDKQAVYEEALNLLKQIPGYKDADKLAAACEMELKNLGASELIPAEDIFKIPANLKIGDVFLFGRYEQEDDKSKGKKPIEWQVLAVENNQALVISKYGLDMKPYNEKFISATWETCTLRNWLNNDFWNSAFSNAEKNSILQVLNRNPRNLKYGTNGGNLTTDRIFLLSIDERNKYFNTVESWQCIATTYAKANGAYVDKDNSYSWWWLRSPGYGSKCAVCVDTDGYAAVNGKNVNYVGIVVRPAFWLSL